MRYLATCSPESKFSLYLSPRDAGFARVSFDGCVQVAQILQVFDPPAEALKLGMKLADNGAVRFALFRVINSRLAYVSVSRGRYDCQISANDAEELGEELSRDVSK